jgi:hypothetical protein
MSSLDGAPLRYTRVCDGNEGYAHLSFTSELPCERRLEGADELLEAHIRRRCSLSKASKTYPANSLGSPVGKYRFWKLLKFLLVETAIREVF